MVNDWVSIEMAVGILGTIVGVIALILYVYDKRKIEPKIIQVLVRKMDAPRKYFLQATLSKQLSLT